MSNAQCIERAPSAQVTNRRSFLHAAAVAGASLVGAGVAVAAEYHPATLENRGLAERMVLAPPVLPPALNAGMIGGFSRIHQTACWVRDDLLQDDPGWELTPQSMRDYFKGEPSLRVERSPDHHAYIGYSGEMNRWQKLICTAYLPEGVTPRREMEMRAWALAYHWQEADADEWTHRLPSVYGHNHFEMGCASALLSGLAGHTLKDGPWRIDY